MNRRSFIKGLLGAAATALAAPKAIIGPVAQTPRHPSDVRRSSAWRSAWKRTPHDARWGPHRGEFETLARLKREIRWVCSDHRAFLESPPLEFGPQGTNVSVLARTPFKVYSS